MSLLYIDTMGTIINGCRRVRKYHRKLFRARIITHTWGVLLEMPQGPWVIQRFTMLYNRLLYSVRLHKQFYCNQRAQAVSIHHLKLTECEHGVNHAFEIQLYACVQQVYQKICFLRISLRRSLNFSLKTVKSGRSLAFWPNRRLFVIPDQRGLHVNAIVKSGFPYPRAIYIAS